MLLHQPFQITESTSRKGKMVDRAGHSKVRSLCSPKATVRRGGRTAGPADMAAAFVSTEGLALRTRRERSRSRKRQTEVGEGRLGRELARVKCPSGLDGKMLICTRQSLGGETPLQAHPKWPEVSRRSPPSSADLEPRKRTYVAGEGRNCYNHFENFLAVFTKIERMYTL